MKIQVTSSETTVNDLVESNTPLIPSDYQYIEDHAQLLQWHAYEPQTLESTQKSHMEEVIEDFLTRFVNWLRTAVEDLAIMAVRYVKDVAIDIAKSMMDKYVWTPLANSLQDISDYVIEQAEHFINYIKAHALQDFSRLQKYGSPIGPTYFREDPYVLPPDSQEGTQQFIQEYSVPKVKVEAVINGNTINNVSKRLEAMKTLMTTAATRRSKTAEAFEESHLTAFIDCISLGLGTVGSSKLTKDELPYGGEPYRNLKNLQFLDTIRWGIKLTNIVPIPSGTLAPPSPFQSGQYYDMNDWLPTTSFDFIKRSVKTYDLNLPNGNSLNIPMGYTSEYELTTNHTELDDFAFINYLNRYFKVIVNGEQVAPYKTITSLLTIYVYRSFGKIMYKQGLLVIPIIEESYTGTSSTGTQDKSIRWSIVGELDLEIGTPSSN